MKDTRKQGYEGVKKKSYDRLKTAMQNGEILRSMTERWTEIKLQGWNNGTFLQELDSTMECESKLKMVSLCHYKISWWCRSSCTVSTKHRYEANSHIIEWKLGDTHYKFISVGQYKWPAHTSINVSQTDGCEASVDLRHVWEVQKRNKAISTISLRLMRRAGWFATCVGGTVAL